MMKSTRLMILEHQVQALAAVCVGLLTVVTKMVTTQTERAGRDDITAELNDVCMKLQAGIEELIPLPKRD